MTTHTYPSPFDQLLALGKPISPWPDYIALGLTAAHVPDLIRLALDNQFDELNADEHPEVWAPIHAWRALGQLRAAEAAEPLTHLLQRVDDEDDDWVGEDLPEAFGLIGPSAIPVLRAYLAEPSHGEFARAATSNSLVEIAKLYPDARRVRCGYRRDVGTLR